METVTRVVDRHVSAAPETTKLMPAQPAPALAVTVSYLLSEDGRKASLLAGGDGLAVQQFTVQVPANRLHLVSVDTHGVARLKLQPRFERDEEQRILRINKPPTYEMPPSLDELFRAAARNHELERTYGAERTVARATRRDSERELREQVAKTFLADATQRAIAHPPPTPARCCLATERGRVFFNADTDTGVAHSVPAEAHRRFRADLRARHERIRQERAAQVALHEEKKRFIAGWVECHGTAEEQGRHAAGMLPMAEAIEAIADQAFAVMGDCPRYIRDGADRLQTHLRQFPQYRDVVVTQQDLRLASSHAVSATRDQWAQVKELQHAKPEAIVTLRAHTLAWRSDLTAPTVTVYGVLVTCKLGPLTLRREYVAPDC